MLKHVLLSLTFIAALAAAGLGTASKAEASHGCGYYGGYGGYGYRSHYPSHYGSYGYGGHGYGYGSRFSYSAATVIRTTDTMVAGTMATMAIAITVTIMAAYTSRLASSVQPAKRLYTKAAAAPARNARAAALLFAAME